MYSYFLLFFIISLSFHCFSNGLPPYEKTIRLTHKVNWSLQNSTYLEKKLNEFLDKEFRISLYFKDWMNDMLQDLRDFHSVIDVFTSLENDRYSNEDIVFLGTQVNLTPGIWKKNNSLSQCVKENLHKVCSSYESNEDCFHQLYVLSSLTVFRMGLMNTISLMSSQLSEAKLHSKLYAKESKKLYLQTQNLFSQISSLFANCNFCGLYYMNKEQQSFLQTLVKYLDVGKVFENSEICFSQCLKKEYPIIFILHKQRGLLTSQNRIKCNHIDMTLRESLELIHPETTLGGLINDHILLCDSKVNSFRFQGRGMSGICYNLVINIQNGVYSLHVQLSKARIRYDNIPFDNVSVYNSSGFIIHNASLQTEDYNTYGILDNRYLTVGLGRRIWVTGGKIVNYDVITRNTVYMDIRNTYVYQHNEWNSGPTLPIPLSGHCMAEINSTHYIIAGGISNGELSKRIWIYSLWEETWTEVKPMPIAIQSPKCSKYNFKGDILITNVEHALSFNSQTHEWTKIGRQGRLLGDGQLVYGGEEIGAICIGGKKTYKFTGEMWIELPNWYNNINPKENPIFLTFPFREPSKQIKECFPVNTNSE